MLIVNLLLGNNNDSLLTASKRFDKIFLFPEIKDGLALPQPELVLEIDRIFSENITEICIVTHSEIVFMRVLRAIREKRVDKNSTNIFWVEKDGRQQKLGFSAFKIKLSHYPYEMFTQYTTDYLAVIKNDTGDKVDV